MKLKKCILTFSKIKCKQTRMPSLSIFTYSESTHFLMYHYGEGTTSQETFQYSLDENTKIAAANHDRRSDIYLAIKGEINRTR